MTVPTQENISQETKPSDKELNFRAQEAKYERLLQQERTARLEAEKVAIEAKQKQSSNFDDDDDDSYSEPYVDPKKLKKEQAKFGQKIKQETQTEIQRAVQMAREEAKREAFLENNPDFYDTLEKHAEKIMERAPALGRAILAMPDNFERQKLVHQTIKELGIDKPKQDQPSIQDRVNANQRDPSKYHPSGVGSSPYQGQAGDFSPQGQKAAWEKMQEAKARLRL
jgi:hypothetical protein